MFESLDKLILAGMGALSMTAERANHIFDEMVTRGQAQRSSQAKFVQDIMDSAQQTRRRLEEIIDKQIEQTVSRMNLATRKDIDRLEEKIDALRGRKHAGSGS
jgi:poly(hydroxyalkanoate) granule-associated protein